MAIQLSKEEKVLDRIKTQRSATQSILSHWNSVIRYRVPLILDSAFDLKTVSGYIVKFSDPSYVRPTALVTGTGKPSILYPAEARRTKQNYEAQMFAKVQIYRFHEGKLIPIPGESQDVYLGNIPVMILSELDHNYGLSPQERYANGESVMDGGGYYISRGMEKTVNSSDHLRLNEPHLHPLDNTALVRYTSKTVLDTTVNIVQEMSVVSGVFQTTFSLIGLNVKYMNIFLVFLALGFTGDTVGTTIKLINSFITGKNANYRRRRARELLEPTISDYQTRIRNGEIQAMIAPFNDNKDFAGKPNREMLIQEAIRQMFLKNITYYPQVPNQNAVLFSKARTLAHMVLMLLEFKMGVRKVHDRDAWGSKMLNTPATALENKLIQIFKAMNIYIQLQINTKGLQTALDIKNVINHTMMGKEFLSAFSKGTWGRDDIPMVESLKRDNSLNARAQAVRIVAPARRQGKIPTKRALHESGFMGICSIYTPEGEPCGLVRDPSVVMMVSHDRDDNIIKARLNNRYITVPNEQATTSLFVNGVHLGFCNGWDVYNYLIGLKRYNQQIYFDTQIYMSEYNELFIATTSGRIVVPYFVVDVPSQQLVIEQKKMWDASIKDLLDAGCLEYVDLKEYEQPHILIASEISELDKYRNDLNVSRSKLSQVEQAFERGEVDQLALDSARFEFNSYDRLARYNYCVVHPQAAFGVSASVMPYLAHNPVTRSIYNCLDPRTSVQMADGNQKPIGSIQIGDIVMTFSPTTMAQEPSRVINQWIRPTDQPTVKVETASGRTVVCTSDHRFMTNQGWKQAKDLLGEKIGIYRARQRDNELGTESKGDLIFVSVSSVTLHECPWVSDITVESDNHSFFADDFASSNCGMARQSLDCGSFRPTLRFDTNIKTQAQPDVPLVTTSTHEHLNMDLYPAGFTAMVAITARANNQEDAIIFNKASLERGLGIITVYHSYNQVIKRTKNHYRKIEIPAHSDLQKHRYSKLDPNTGIVRLGAYVEAEDCLIGITVTDNETKKSENGSVFLETGKSGRVEEVFETYNTEACKMICIRIRETFSPEVGDKAASRYSQKGVIGEIVPEESMPFIMSADPRLNGIRPDIMFGTHGLPSRMTVGMIIESLVSKLAIAKGERVNASAFNRADIRSIKKELRELGFRDGGKETMLNGMTGEVYEVDIFFGPIYYQWLRHFVRYKYQARSTGPIQYVTHQPVAGRKRAGGLRYGEMERDSSIARGSQALLQERFKISSDVFEAIVCGSCGTFATNDPYNRKLTCPCSKTGGGNYKKISIPYPLKVLIYYLSAMNIKMMMNLGRRHQFVE